jgi:hypothetical protein
MSRYVYQEVLDLSKDRSALKRWVNQKRRETFKTSGTTRPKTWRHISEDRNLRQPHHKTRTCRVYYYGLHYAAAPSGLSNKNSEN